MNVDYILGLIWHMLSGITFIFFVINIVIGVRRKKMRKKITTSEEIAKRIVEIRQQFERELEEEKIRKDKRNKLDI